MNVFPARHNNQRPDYRPSWAAETFIVPLLLRRILDLLERCRNASPLKLPALDVGCGKQPFRSSLENSGYAYASLDVVQNQAGTVNWIGPIDAPLPPGIPRGQFHFILCTEVLEHVAEWESAWRNLAELLASGGRLIVTCPHLYPLHEVPYDFWRPTPYAIRHFAAKNHLEVEMLESAGCGREALGTVLSLTHCYSLDRRWRTRASCWVAQRVRDLALRALSHPAFFQRVEVRSPYFLSTIALLRKPPAGVT